MKDLGMSADEQHEVLKMEYGGIDSYLIESHAIFWPLKIFQDGEPLVEKILDTVGQKGTGKWTVVSLWIGIPLTFIDNQLFSRCLSVKGGFESSFKKKRSLRHNLKAINNK